MASTGIFERFRRLEGAGRIASAFAVEGLAYWLRRQRPRRILEVGAGVGCLSEVIRRWLVTDFAAFVDAEVVCVEDDPWCQARWRENLPTLPPGMRLVDKIPDEFFDFVVLDGPQIRASDWLVLAPRATVFVEGGRRGQRGILEMTLGIVLKRAFCAAGWKPGDRTKGYTVYQLAPTRAERRWFGLVRIREALLDLPPRLLGRPVGKRRS